MDEEFNQNLAKLPKGRQQLLLEQFRRSTGGVSDAASLKTATDLFSQRVLSEVESFERVKRRASELRKSESEIRKLALLLTFLVLVVAVSLGIYLSDDRRLYSVHEFFAKWYYELFVHDPRKGNRLFIDKDENYDMYA